MKRDKNKVGEGLCLIHRRRSLVATWARQQMCCALSVPFCVPSRSFQTVAQGLHIVAKCGCSVRINVDFSGGSDSEWQHLVLLPHWSFWCSLGFCRTFWYNVWFPKQHLGWVVSVYFNKCFQRFSVLSKGLSIYVSLCVVPRSDMLFIFQNQCYNTVKFKLWPFLPMTLIILPDVEAYYASEVVRSFTLLCGWYL